MDSRKGLVMEISGGNAILLWRDGGFRRVRVPASSSWRVGQEVDPAAAVSRAWRPRPALALAMSLLVLLLAGMPIAGYLHLRSLPVVAYLSVDINPSFELGVDARGRTVSVKPLSPDAEAILSGVNLRGSVEAVVSRLVRMSVASGYLSTLDAIVIITVAPASAAAGAPGVTGPSQGQGQSGPAAVGATAASKATKAQIQVEQTSQRALAQACTAAEQTLAQSKHENRVQALKVDSDTREEAKSAGLSPGKFAIMLVAQQQNLPVTVEDMKKGGVAQVIKNAGGHVGEVVGRAAQEDDFHSLSEELKVKDLEKSQGKEQGKGTDKDRDTGKDTGKEQGKEQGKAGEPTGVPAGPAPGGRGAAGGSGTAATPGGAATPSGTVAPGGTATPPAAVGITAPPGPAPRPPEGGSTGPPRAGEQTKVGKEDSEHSGSGQSHPAEERPGLMPAPAQPAVPTPDTNDDVRSDPEHGVNRKSDEDDAQTGELDRKKVEVKVKVEDKGKDKGKGKGGD